MTVRQFRIWKADVGEFQSTVCRFQGLHSSQQYTTLQQSHQAQRYAAGIRVSLHACGSRESPVLYSTLSITREMNNQRPGPDNAGPSSGITPPTLPTSPTLPTPLAAHRSPSALDARLDALLEGRKAKKRFRSLKAYDTGGSGGSGGSGGNEGKGLVDFVSARVIAVWAISINESNLYTCLINSTSNANKPVHYQNFQVYQTNNPRRAPTTTSP